MFRIYNPRDFYKQVIKSFLEYNFEAASVFNLREVVIPFHRYFIHQPANQISHMKKLYFVLPVLFLGFSAHVLAQSFTNSTSLINAQNFNSGGCTAVADMDEDGYDDLVILHQSKNVYIYYQESNGTFTLFNYGQISSSSQWGMTVGDIDQDGHKDVISGGNSDGVHHMSISSRGVSSMTNLPNGNVFMQGCNLADINNDGWLDFFACHDVGTSKIWGNDGTGTLLFENWIDLTTTPSSDNSGNYGSVWTDFDNDGDIDLYIAKCRQGVNNENDPRRINMLFVNNGDGTYTEKAAERSIAIKEQSWTVDFADIDNDGDFDMFLTNHTNTLTLYENDGLGYYTEITEGSGFEFGGFFLQSKFVDFDNDGFVDLLYSGESWGLFRNNGNKTFTDITATSNLITNDDLHSFGIGDLNKDGFLDIYASYGNTYVNADMAHPDKLWLNDTNDNNWIAYTLEGTISNTNAVGAKAFIYGDWGVQVREVRAGESYGISNTFSLHFGIGTSTSVDQIVIQWPSGLTNVIENPAINTFHTVIEGACDNPTASISASATALCAGQSSELTATVSGSDFIWSTGETTSTIEVSDPGNYYVYTWNNNGCSGSSEPLMLQFEIPVPPIASAMGELEFCEGGSVMLMAEGGSNYVWSSGGQGEMIEITASGLYSVTANVNCGTASSSNIAVNVIPGPVSPMVNDVQLPVSGEATLTGNIEQLNWYLNENDSDPAGTGISFTTPFNNGSTEYWVESFIQYGGEFGNGGKPDDSGNGQFHQNSNFWLVFNANEDLVITSVKVYSEVAGERNIQVVDAQGNVVTEGTFMIAAGEQVVELGLFVPEGSGYGLRTTGNPQLWRNGDGVDISFPYDLDGLGSIVSSSVSGANALNFYYFFYDWSVETPLTICYSPRVPVQVTIVGLDEIDGLNALNVYPVPAKESISIEIESTESGLYNVSIIDITGRMVTAETMAVNAGHKTTRTLDVSSLSSGVYSLVLELDGQRAVRRMVIE